MRSRYEAHLPCAMRFSIPGSVPCPDWSSPVTTISCDAASFMNIWTLYGCIITPYKSSSCNITTIFLSNRGFQVHYNFLYDKIFNVHNFCARLTHRYLNKCFITKNVHKVFQITTTLKHNRTVQAGPIMHINFLLFFMSRDISMPMCN